MEYSSLEGIVRRFSVWTEFAAFTRCAPAPIRRPRSLGFDEPRSRHIVCPRPSSSRIIQANVNFVAMVATLEGAGMDPLLKWRGEFPILGRTTYMISNSLGAMPRGVYDQMRAYADSWAERGVRAWEEGWWEMAVGVGDKIAPLIA